MEYKHWANKSIDKVRAHLKDILVYFEESRTPFGVEWFLSLTRNFKRFELQLVIPAQTIDIPIRQVQIVPASTISIMQSSNGFKICS